MVLYVIETILFMLGGIGALLIGFEMLSNSITKIFHSQLKSLFNKTSSNPLIGVLIGLTATMIIQSSGATTVMIVGFVNTGIMNLFQATAMIMGSNIGTTITAQIASLSGGSGFDFGAIALGFTGIGAFISLFSKNEKAKTFGNFLAGFGLLFLGLDCVSTSIGMEYNGSPLFKQAIEKILSNEFISTSALAPFLLFLVGIVMTALTQSSSLITSIVIAFVAKDIFIGAAPGSTSLNNNVLYLILGTNIGSCVTALLSSTGATTNAKRASCIHLLFNTIGSVVFMIFLLLWPSFMEQTFVKWFHKAGSQIAMFHTFFNVTCTLLFLPFIKVFVKVASTIVKDKEVVNDSPSLVFVDERLLSTPSVAVHQVRKELGLMYSKALETLNTALNGFLNYDPSVRDEVDKSNDELYVTNKLVVEYIVKLSTQQLVLEDEATLSSFQRTLNDILRIGEIAENICKYTKQAVTNELVFSSNVMLHIGFMKNKINALYEKSDEIFMTKNINKIPEADVIEDEIDLMRKQMIEDHMERLKLKECSPQNSGVFVNLVNNMERAADHMVYIAYSVKEAKEQFQK